MHLMGDLHANFTLAAAAAWIEHKCARIVDYYFVKKERKNVQVKLKRNA